MLANASVRGQFMTVGFMYCGVKELVLNKIVTTHPVKQKARHSIRANNI